MSREQGPREAGMRASANAAGHRREGVSGYTKLSEVTGMSRDFGVSSSVVLDSGIRRNDGDVRIASQLVAYPNNDLFNTNNLSEVTA